MDALLVVRGACRSKAVARLSRHKIPVPGPDSSACPQNNTVVVTRSSHRNWGKQEFDPEPVLGSVSLRQVGLREVGSC
jgi:hypothetical protein